eukprot:SAG31_NODE_970_length_10676_cov_12.566985_3_plen_628_part_00
MGMHRNRPGAGWANIGGVSGCIGCLCDTERSGEHPPLCKLLVSCTSHTQRPCDLRPSRMRIADIRDPGNGKPKVLEHTLRLTDAQSEGRSLLGRHEEFCAAYYHMFPVWEGEVLEQICIDPAQCVLSHVVICMARLQSRPWRPARCQRGSNSEIDLHEHLSPEAIPDRPTDPTGGGSMTDDEWADEYVARYQNCWRGGEKTNYHAEQFMLEDADLAARLEHAKSRQKEQEQQGDAATPGNSHAIRRREVRLTIYLTYQPCHFSGGHVKNIGKAVTTSCTNRLLLWSRAVLQPAGVTLVIRLAKLYRLASNSPTMSTIHNRSKRATNLKHVACNVSVIRAHWEEGTLHKTEEERLHYGERAAAAREGMKLLMTEPGIEMVMMDPDDWRYLAGLADDYVLEKLMAAESKVPFEKLEEHQAALTAQRAAEAEMLTSVEGKNGERMSQSSRGVGGQTTVDVLGLACPCWAALSSEQRAAVVSLGWGPTQADEEWDAGVLPPVTELAWSEMSSDQQVAASSLGFSGLVWDGEVDPSLAQQIAQTAVDLAVQALWNGGPDIPSRVACKAVHPQWRDSSRERPWFVHFWPDGRFWKQDPRRKSNLTATLHVLVECPAAFRVLLVEQVARQATVG